MAKFAELRDYPVQLLAKNSKYVKWAINATIFILYNAFWIGCLSRYITQGTEVEDFAWCDGIGFLTILTIIVYTGANSLEA